MGKPYDYNPIAINYSKTRDAVTWVLEPLINLIRPLLPDSKILEIGCGTGNYIITLSSSLPQFEYYGFDISEEMLRLAKSRSDFVNFIHGNAEDVFPFENGCFEISFCVDVIHHIVNIENFFKETVRCLKKPGKFILVTDLEENIHKRSLSKFFPEILKVELDRYPSFELMKTSALNAGMDLSEIIPAESYRDIDDTFIERARSKNSSSMRLISDDAHKKGMERLMKAKGEKWFSTYSILVFKK